MKSTWTKTSLGVAFSTLTGNTPPKSDPQFYGNSVPLVKPPELRDSTLKSAGDGLSEEGAKVARVAPTNSILVSCIGNLGKVGLTAIPVAFNQQINAILPHASRAIAQFMFYQALSPSFKEQLEAAACGTTISIVNKSKFNSIQIVLPPLTEQRRIVAILDEAFASIAIARANAEKNLQNARELFESYLRDLFTHEGGGWITRRLEDVCSGITVGHVGSMAKEYKNAGVPFLRSQNIRPFKVTLDNVVFIDEVFHRALTKSRLKPGDVAIVRTGYPGTAAVIPENVPDSNCSDLVIVRPGKEVDPHYLAAFFNSAYGKELVAGKLVGAAQKHFNIAAAKEVKIHLPPVAEQGKVVGELFAFRAEAQCLESIYQRKLAALDELKQSLLHEAFSGKL